MAKFILINNDMVMNKVYENDNLEFVFYELLSYVDLSLSQLINHNIQTKKSKLNFDKLCCLAVIDTPKKIFPQIINTYKFDIGKMVFYDNFNQIFIIPPSCQLLSDSIKNKIEIIESKHTPKNTGPKKHIIKPDNNGDIVQEIIEKSSDLLETEIIPNSLLEEEIQKIRPMNSIILEKDGDLSELKEKMELLKVLKETEEKKLKELEQIKEKDSENFVKYCEDVNDNKRLYFKEKERAEERRNRFEANKVAYNRMKQDILNGKLSENNISCLFANEYPIYKFMDQKQLLDQPDDYITFLNIYDQMHPNNTLEKENTYVPHNIHYLSEDEQKTYQNVKETQKDLIEEFINHNNNNNNNNKSYPPIEEVLSSIDHDENQDDDQDLECNNIANFEE